MKTADHMYCFRRFFFYNLFIGKTEMTARPREPMMTGEEALVETLANQDSDLSQAILGSLQKKICPMKMLKIKYI